VALVDTEGETAIDVFYITRDGAKLESDRQRELKQNLLSAIEANAGGPAATSSAGSAG
jgi:[protein-PII] uridylyltransferase